MIEITLRRVAHSLEVAAGNCEFLSGERRKYGTSTFAAWAWMASAIILASTGRRIRRWLGPPPFHTVEVSLPGWRVTRACECPVCMRGQAHPFRTMGDEARFWIMAIGLALIVIACLPGCVHRPTPEDPARCAVGASTSISRGTGHQFGEPFYSEDTTVTLYGQCDL